jgi:gluconolactonase
VSATPPLRELATGLEFPEGPVALGDGSVLVVEIRRGTLSRISPRGAVDVVAELGGGPNGAAIGPDGACYVANNGGFRWREHDGSIHPFDREARSNEPDDFRGGWIDRVDLGSGEHSVLYRDLEGRPFCGPNDLVFDTSGGFWFTDFGKIRAHDADLGALYYARADGSSVELVSHGLHGPNGVGLSPGGERVYVAETYTGRVLAWDVLAPGRVRHRAPMVLAATTGSLDSMTLEENGRLLVAALADGLCAIEEDGSIHHYTPIPDAMTTNLCFGGPDRRTAFVTCSGAGRLVALEWPRAGIELAFTA